MILFSVTLILKGNAWIFCVPLILKGDTWVIFVYPSSSIGYKDSILFYIPLMRYMDILFCHMCTSTLLIDQYYFLGCIIWAI